MKTNLSFSQIPSFQDILNLSSKEFEDFCAFLLGQSKEYSNICVTPFRGDKGIDITCEYHRNPVYIQCKQWSSEYKKKEKKFYVEPRYIREFAGAMRREKAIYGIFITTLTFSPKAISEAKSQKIRLINKFDICQKMQSCINPNFSFDEKTLKKQKHDYVLLKKLKDIRKEIALLEEKPPHYILRNRTLEEFCYLKPQTREEFLRIHGIGEIKWKQYGKIFSSIIKRHLKEKEEGEYLDPQKELPFSKKKEVENNILSLEKRKRKEVAQPQLKLTFFQKKPKKDKFFKKMHLFPFRYCLSWKQSFAVGVFSFLLFLLLIQENTAPYIWKASSF